MLDFNGDEYMRGFDFPEYIFSPKELREFLEEKRRIYDSEYRKYLDEEFIQKLEAKNKIVPLLTVT